MAFVPLEEEEEEEEDTEFLVPKFQSQPSDAVRIFCGPNVGLVWPWKAHSINDNLVVRGCKLRGHYWPTNYKQLQEDLDNNRGIQQALATQQALLEVRAEVKAGMLPTNSHHRCPPPVLAPFLLSGHAVGGAGILQGASLDNRYL